MKKEVKTCALAIVLVLMFSMIAQLILPLSVVKAHTDAGDINKDEVLNTSDVAQLRTAIVNNTDLGGTLKLGDLNEDGLVDITDVMLLKRAIVDEVKVGIIDRTNLQIGDYVDYTPDTATAYSKDKLAESISGSSDNTTDITQDNLKWKILRKYPDGSMDLIGSTTLTDINIGGAIGYNNGVNIMNDICKSLYSKSSAGIEARSVNINDYEYWLTDEGKTTRDDLSATYIGGPTYGHTQTYTTNRDYPSLYSKEIGGKIDSGLAGLTEGIDKEIGSTIGLKPSEEGNATGIAKANTSLTVTQTDYDLIIDSTNFGDGAKALFDSNRVHWIASRCTDCASDVSSFGIHVSIGSIISGAGEFVSGKLTNITDHYQLRPVVTIPADLKILASDTAGEETGTPHKITNYGKNFTVDGGDMEVSDYTRASEELPNPTLKLITVYTNDDTKAYKYNGNVMYDITDSGYMHNGKTYSKVYGYFSTEPTIYESNVTAVPASSVTVEKIIYPTPYKMDVTRDGRVTSQDSLWVLQVAYESSDRTKAIDRFSADIYRKKCVTPAEAELILKCPAGLADPW